MSCEVEAGIQLVARRRRRDYNCSCSFVVPRSCCYVSRSSLSSRPTVTDYSTFCSHSLRPRRIEALTMTTSCQWPTTGLLSSRATPRSPIWACSCLWI